MLVDGEKLLERLYTGKSSSPRNIFQDLTEFTGKTSICKCFFTMFYRTSRTTVSWLLSLKYNPVGN